MQVTALRLTGFKSFVDSAELVIAPGITGVVGPNGCGKSNLVEALSWVMGESSARRLRGGDMDELIFGGTAARPSRNLAEVLVRLDNRDRTAPAAFNQWDEIEVCRRLARGTGSDYRVNGRAARARDVQLLFQDQGAGPGSAAFVGQGRVGALITARPTERRQILEEAAGILGLQGRRQEAEQRLRAAEANLTRLDDVLGAMSGQLGGLRKQARQAARYRAVSERIRAAEALLLALRWRAAESRMAEAQAAWEAAEAAVRAALLAATQAGRAQTEAAAALPPLRQAAAAAAMAHQRLAVERARAEAEATRAAESERDARRRLAQIEADAGRERGLSAEAEQALARLDRECGRLREAQSAEAEAQAAALAAVEGARGAVAGLDAEVTALTEAVAADEARHQELIRRRTEAERRAAELKRRHDALAGECAALERAGASAPDLAAAEAAVAVAEGVLAEARGTAERAEAHRLAAEAADVAARSGLHAAESSLARLAAEAAGLRAALGAGQGAGARFAPALDAVTVTAGHEAALAAALGDDLLAPVDPSAPVHWAELPPLDREAAPLPTGIEPLAAQVTAPPALARRLAHIGLVSDAAAGTGIAARLGPGQQVVSRDGAAWRWDGLCRRAGAPAPAAVRLQQRNRLAELDDAIAAAGHTADEARGAAAAARQTATCAVAEDRAARQAVQSAFAELSGARDRHARQAQEAGARQSRLAGLVETRDRLAADLADADNSRTEAGQALAALPDTAQQRRTLANQRSTLAQRRSELGVRQGTLDALGRESAGRRRRLDGLAQEERSWRARAAGTGERLAELAARAAEARAALSDLAGKPEALGRGLDELCDALAEAERLRARSADALSVGETRQIEADRAAKAADSALATAREARLRAEAGLAAARTAAQAVAERIAEQLDCRPAGAVALAGLDPAAPPPDPAEIEARLARLVREREGLGAVNLRAEAEAAELEAQVATMTAERADVQAAVSRLRHGLSSLDREARERLVGSFEAVDRHFQDLFARLFGGGRARLALTEADDPLEAGLEVLASPPGKRLQSLTLLSGGEQALTALALLFAVFLTRPAPVCVLDEVDAALDDANVDRFCTLLEELAAAGATRFLVITHHRMTMARSDRLFGVTMPERGVSQLVSVDLQRAEELAERSRPATPLPPADAAAE